MDQSPLDQNQQPIAPSETPEAPQQPTVGGGSNWFKKLTSNTKLLWGTMFAFAVIGGGVLVWKLGDNSEPIDPNLTEEETITEEETSTTPEEETTTTGAVVPTTDCEDVASSAGTSLRVLVDGKFKYVDSDNKLVADSALPDVPKTSEYLGESGGYVLMARADSNGSFIGASAVDCNGEVTKIELADSLHNSPSLSPDGSHLAYNVSTETEANPYPSVEVLNLNTGVKTQLIQGKTGLILLQSGWLDNDSLILSEAQCWGCDGGLLPKLKAVDIATKKVSTLTSSNNSDITGYSYPVFSPNRDFVAYLAGPGESAYGPTYTQEDTDIPMFLYSYNVASDKATLVMTKKKPLDFSPMIVGWSKDGSKIILAMDTLVPIAGEQYQAEFSRVILANKSGSGSSNINLNIPELKNTGENPNGRIVEATHAGSTLYFVTENYSNQTNKLRIITISEGTVAVETLATGSNIDIIGWGTSE